MSSSKGMHYSLSLATGAFTRNMRGAMSSLGTLTGALSKIGNITTGLASMRGAVDTLVSPFTKPVTLAGDMESLETTGLPAGYLVEEVVLEEGNGGTGRMVVVARKPDPSYSFEGQAQLGDTLYELDWYEERRPIEEHPKCGDLRASRNAYAFPQYGADYDGQAVFTDPKKGRQRTWDHWQVLEEDDYAESGTSGSWSLAQYKSLKEKGINDYPVAYPVARKTIYTRSRLAPTGNVWKNENPPADVTAPNGWYYVKSAERITKSGRVWTRVEEWRGYSNADDLFFL